MPDPVPVEPVKPWWLSKTLWLNALSFAIVVITAMVDTDLVKQNPELVLSFMALVNVLNAILRFATTKGVAMVLLAACLLAAPFSLSFAAEPTVINPPPGLADGDHHVTITVRGGELVGIRPLKTLTWGSNPSPPTVPPTNPPPGNNPTPFELEIETQARNAIQLGGSLTTGAGFSEVYAIVSDGVSKGTIDHTRCLEAVNLGTAAILSRSADGAKWSTFELTTRNALQTLDARGNFKTKDDYAAALKQVSNGISRATGHKPMGAKLLTLDVSTPAKMAAAVKANGILDGIDFEKLMELILFIVELFKLFAPK